jgi:hypothetical protein
MKLHKLILIGMLFCIPQTAGLACVKWNYGPELEGFTGQPLTKTDFTKLEDIADFYMPSWFITGDIREIETVDDPSGKYDMIMTITSEDMPSYFLSAEQQRIGIKKEGELLIVKTVGRRLKCLFGKNRENWTTKKCPTQK